MVGNLKQKLKIGLLQNLTSPTNRCPAQIGGAPAVRLDFLLEEPLHADRTLRGAASLQRAADLVRKRCSSSLSPNHLIYRRCGRWPHAPVVNPEQPGRG